MINDPFVKLVWVNDPRSNFKRKITKVSVSYVTTKFNPNYDLDITYSLPEAAAACCKKIKTMIGAYL